MFLSVKNDLLIYENFILNTWLLHFPSHPCDPAQEAEDFPGITVADFRVSSCVVVPIPPAVRSPAARTPAAASAQPLGGCEARIPAAVRGP